MYSSSAKWYREHLPTGEGCAELADLQVEEDLLDDSSFLRWEAAVRHHLSAREVEAGADWLTIQKVWACLPVWLERNGRLAHFCVCARYYVEDAFPLDWECLELVLIALRDFVCFPSLKEDVLDALCDLVEERRDHERRVAGAIAPMADAPLMLLCAQVLSAPVLDGQPTVLDLQPPSLPAQPAFVCYPLGQTALLDCAAASLLELTPSSELSKGAVPLLMLAPQLHPLELVPLPPPPDGCGSLPTALVTVWPHGASAVLSLPVWKPLVLASASPPVGVAAAPLLPVFSCCPLVARMASSCALQVRCLQLGGWRQHAFDPGGAVLV